VNKRCARAVGEIEINCHCLSSHFVALECCDPRILLERGETGGQPVLPSAFHAWITCSWVNASGCEKDVGS